MGSLGPFRLKPNEAKSGQVSNPPASKARWGPTEPILAPNLKNPKNGQKDSRNHILATFQPWPLETTRGHQLRSRKVSPPFMGRPLLHQCTPYQRIQSWCIYGIVYPYAPLFPRNPMRMFSVPHCVFSIQLPKSITHFE
ncbi:hypothetical protein O181_059548 [Austropuccinia psidii MF-1]|uniref:Uncharacterized protein n=1 Tax=Austropuccinia psidii MF-1 TaxID=1389203 RepID=A0A9Q3HWL8_9BASI|nr:hypothetical protein [Austropuccinia psidii MF-1]